MNFFDSIQECQRAEAFARDLAKDPSRDSGMIRDAVLAEGFSIEALSYGFAHAAATTAHRDAVRERERVAARSASPYRDEEQIPERRPGLNPLGLPPLTPEQQKQWDEMEARDEAKRAARQKKRDDLRAERARNDKESWRKLMQDIQDDIENKAIGLAEEMVVQWTADLLASTFALSDGTRVTWADATQQQHRDRIEMLVKQAAGTVETAALHEKALKEIAQAGVKRLGELPQEGEVI